MLLLITTAATDGLTPRTVIRIPTLHPTINIVLPKTDLLHLPKHPHITLGCSTRVLGNVYIARLLVTLLSGTYPHSHHASTDTNRNAFVHTAISYPVIGSTCKVAKACTIGESRTHTTCPRRPIRLTLLLVAPLMGSLLSHPTVPAPRFAPAASGRRDSAKSSTP